MSQIDMFGNASRKPFKDIGNQRDSTASRKAHLSLELGALLKRIPAGAVNGSVQEVCKWKAAHDECEKVAGKVRASVMELEMAIKRMREFFEPDA